MVQMYLPDAPEEVVENSVLQVWLVGQVAALRAGSVFTCIDYKRATESCSNVVTATSEYRQGQGSL